MRLWRRRGADHPYRVEFTDVAAAAMETRFDEDTAVATLKFVETELSNDPQGAGVLLRHTLGHMYSADFQPVRILYEIDEIEHRVKVLTVSRR